jgi:hypothetical protein
MSFFFLFFFYKIREQEAGTGPAQGRIGASGRGRDGKEMV